MSHVPPEFRLSANGHEVLDAEGAVITTAPSPIIDLRMTFAGFAIAFHDPAAKLLRAIEWRRDHRPGWILEAPAKLPIVSDDGRLVRMPGGAVIRLPEVAAQIRVIDTAIVALVRPSVDAVAYTPRNVYCFDDAGILLWRVSSPLQYPDTSYTYFEVLNDQLWVVPSGLEKFLVDRASGKIIGKGPTR